MNLRDELDELDLHKNPHERGRRFEAFLAHMLEEEGFRVSRNPGAALPRQTDLAARQGETYFLVEAKWLRKPVGIGHVSQVRERVRVTPPDVFACVFSMSGYTDGAIKEACKERTREVILFNDREVRDVATGELSFEELLTDKRDALRIHAEAYFCDREPSAMGSLHLRTGRDIIQVGDRTRDWLPCHSENIDVVFSNEPLDFTARYRGAVISMELRLDLKKLSDLQRVLKMADNLLGLSNEGCFAIHQQKAAWYGFGPENFVETVKAQQSRYAELELDSYHHSEELAYVDRIITGGLFCLSSRQSTGGGNHLHTSQIETLMPGIPVEMASIKKFCSRTGNPEAILEAVGEDPVKKRAFRPKVGVESVAAILSESDGRKWVSGLVVKNPFHHGRIPFVETAPFEEPFRFLSKEEFLFCALRSWHRAGVRMDHYELRFVESCWVGHAAVFYVLCDWN